MVITLHTANKAYICLYQRPDYDHQMIVLCFNITLTVWLSHNGTFDGIFEVRPKF